MSTDLLVSLVCSTRQQKTVQWMQRRSGSFMFCLPFVFDLDLVFHGIFWSFFAQCHSSVISTFQIFVWLSWIWSSAQACTRGPRKLIFGVEAALYIIIIIIIVYIYRIDIKKLQNYIRVLVPYTENSINVMRLLNLKKFTCLHLQ